MKIWDVLNGGKDGDVYRLSNTIPAWENTEIQVKTTGMESVVLVYATLPKIKSTRIGIGRTIVLCGAVTKADWVFVENRDAVSSTLGSELEELVSETTFLLDALREWNVGSVKDSSVVFRRQREWVYLVEHILEKRMTHVHLLELIDENEHQLMFRLKRELEETVKWIYSLTIDELSEHLEFLLSLIWYLFEKVWKLPLHYQQYFHFPLDEDEMLLLLSDKNVKRSS